MMNRPHPSSTLAIPPPHPTSSSSSIAGPRRPSGGRPAPPSSSSSRTGPNHIQSHQFSSRDGPPTRSSISAIPSSPSPSFNDKDNHEPSSPPPFRRPNHQAHLMQHRPSFPSPKSGPVVMPLPLPEPRIRKHQPNQYQHQHQHQHQYQHGVDSDVSSPALSSGSELGSLTESTRANIMRPPPQPPHGHSYSYAKPHNGGQGHGHPQKERRGGSMASYAEMRSPREAVLETPREAYTPQVAVRDDLEAHLDQLFDTLQVPDSVRAKFSTVSPDVKSSILTSSYSSNPAVLQSLGLPGAHAHPSTPEKGKSRPGNLRKRLSQPILRKAKSSSSLGSPGPGPGGSPQVGVGKTYRVDGETFTIVASPTSLAQPSFPGPSPVQAKTNSKMNPNGRGQSMDLSSGSRPSFASMRTSTGPGTPGGRPLSLALFGGGGGAGGSGEGSGPGGGGGKHSKKGSGLSGVGLGIAVNGEQPESFISWLRAFKSTDLRMEVDRMKKLRMLLRHEKTEWVGRFVGLGGYILVMDRLQDLLDVEWREEQHDDQMLYEILRCIKALSTSEIGKNALRSTFPRPFSALSALLFSEKKPGDLSSRQVIIEMWLFIFELYPPSHSSSSSSSSAPVTTPNFASPRRPGPGPGQVPGCGSRPTSVRFDTGQADQMAEMLRQGQASTVDAVREVRNLLVPEPTEAERKGAEQHDFITSIHRPKVFRAWVQELSDICRDYFWIMCHGTNTLWIEEEVDERLVSRPVAPGGATGGVEFEAMNYVIVHFRLLNTLCHHTAQQDRRAATEMHSDLLMSGMDRILVTMRKASTTFYPTLHLELARYVTHLRLASLGARLPHLIEKLLGSPPEEYRLRGQVPAQLHLQQPQGGYSSRYGNGDRHGGMGMPRVEPGGQRRGAFDMQL